MSVQGNCIKTGARVYLADYDSMVAADIFDTGESVTINFNPQSWQYNSGPEGSTHSVFLPISAPHFFHKEKGVIVAPKFCVQEAA